MQTFQLFTRLLPLLNFLAAVEQKSLLRINTGFTLTFAIHASLSTGQLLCKRTRMRISMRERVCVCVQAHALPRATVSRAGANCLSGELESETLTFPASSLSNTSTSCK